MRLGHLARRAQVRASFAVLALLGTGLSCSDSATAPTFRGPISMDIVSGDNQSAAAGSELPNPLVVVVKDANGNPVEGQVVNFVVTSGGGSVFAGAAETNANGRAQDWWTLGTDPNAAQVLEVRAVDPETGEKLVFATFHATIDRGAVTRVEVTPSSAKIRSGGTVQLSAVAFDAGGGNPSVQYEWTSSDESVATVDGSGLVTGHGGGSATIRATSGGQYDEAVITVSPVAWVSVSPCCWSYPQVGDRIQYTAQALDASFQPIPGKTATWTSSDPSLVSVDQNGLATVLARTPTSPVTITATIDGVQQPVKIWVE